MECICRDRHRRLNGRDAHEYIAHHLTPVWSDGHDLTGFVCPDTGTLWVLDDPQDERSALGPARLRVVSPEVWEAAKRPDFRARQLQIADYLLQSYEATSTFQRAGLNVMWPHSLVRPASMGPVAIEETWTVRRAEALLGEISVSDGDFPWLKGSWSSTRDFEDVRPLFEAELALLNKDVGSSWDDAYRRIWDAGLRLYCPDGTKAPEFLLHIERDVAWFRWHDEPFPEGGIGDDAA